MGKVHTLGEPTNHKGKEKNHVEKQREAHDMSSKQIIIIIKKAAVVVGLENYMFIV